MAESSYFQLLNPIIMVVFAVGFHAIWRVDRAQDAARLMALAYVTGAVGFTLDFFVRDAVGPYWGSFVSNVPFAVCVALTACGAYARAGRALPVRAVTILGGLSLAGVAASLLALPDTTLRALSMNFGTGALFALGAWGLRGRPRTVDRVLMVLLAASALQSVARPLVVLWVNGLGDVALSYTDSVYALALHFCSAIVALSVASAMLFALGAEVVGRLEERGDTDPLTGLLNRRGLSARVSDIHEGTVIVADIDRFKSVNDRHGHAAGDAVLREFARTLRRLGPGATPARLGGEEFAVVLSGVDLIRARLAAEGARASFAAMPHPALGDERVTASFGIAPLQEGSTLNDAILAADRALYAAKRAGRDRTVVAGEEGWADALAPANTDRAREAVA